MTLATVNLEIRDLDKLRKKIGAPTRADVVRRALALLDIAADRADQRSVTIGEGPKKVTVIL